MDILDTYDAAAKKWGKDAIAEIWGCTYSQDPAECVRHATEALRNPKALDDLRRLRAGIGIALRVGDRLAAIRIDPTPEALELAQKITWGRDSYSVRGTHSGSRWLLFQPHAGIPAEGATLVPGFRLMAAGEVVPLPPTYFSRFERMAWDGRSPFSGPMDPTPAPAPAEFPAEILSLIPKPKAKGSKP